MKITKLIMEQEAKRIIANLLSLPEVEKVQIKDYFISSIEDSENIDKGLDDCYHDKFSDLDINVYIHIHPDEHSEKQPIYFDNLHRIGLIEDSIIGIHPVPRSEAIEKEGIRFLLKNGIRIDFTCFVTCDYTLASYGWVKHPMEENKIKSYNFWFTAIHALGKLIRKDYLISSHLAHSLIMEGIVLQMLLRDKEYDTCFHRYGYSENLEYLEISQKDDFELAKTLDLTYNNIAQLLYSALVSYEKLMPLLDSAYQCRLQDFLEIWKSYVTVD